MTGWKDWKELVIISFILGIFIGLLMALTIINI